MKETSRQNENEMKRQVRPWMEARKLSPVLFDKLRPYNKRLLHNIVCVGCEKISYAQLRDLYKDLGVAETREGSHDPTDEELKTFLCPDDGIPSLWKF